MRANPITPQDISKVTGYSRNQVRGLLDKLPGYAESAAMPGIAREYTRSDLLVLAVIVYLETKVKVHRKALASIVGFVKKEFSGPKEINRDARLLVSIDPPAAHYLPSADIAIPEGVVIALGPIFIRVDDHLKQKFENPYTGAVNSELNFGPTLATTRRKRANG